MGHGIAVGPRDPSRAEEQLAWKAPGTEPASCRKDPVNRQPPAKNSSTDRNMPPF
jgi:hypothetical protein